ncbi:MAG: hypothetical protein HQL54_07515 [Magnetococcales bacterium]|nr:hypothetical protein [Magnetococcales bacterium]
MKSSLQTLSKLFLVISLTFMISGCGESDNSWATENDGWDDDYARDDAFVEVGLWEELQGRLGRYSEILSIMVGVFQDQPEALHILRGQATAEDWKTIDKSALREALMGVKDNAEELGFSMQSNDVSDWQKDWARGIGNKMGVSSDRMDELEGKYEANKDRLPELMDRYNK